MALRYRIHDEVKAGRLPVSWTTADLLGNSKLSKEFEHTTLRTEPPNCSRSADGMGLGDGKNSDDYFYYVRVGYRVSHSRRPLLYQLCVNAGNRPALSRESSVGALEKIYKKSENRKSTPRESDATEILDELENTAAPIVDAMKKRIADGTAGNEDAWYQASYAEFTKRGNPKTRADFICVIAFAYSWLPTNRLAASPTEDHFKELKVAVKRAQKDGSDDNRKALIYAAQTAIGVSHSAVITVSKVLHFWDVSLAPMFDINIKRALEKLRVPRASDGDEPDRAIANYLWYWRLADVLLHESKTHSIGPLDYRRLDELMFQMGRIQETTPSGDTRKGPPEKKRHQQNKSLSGKHRNLNKRELTDAIYVANRGQTRQKIIELFKNAGLTPAGAITYYQNCRTRGI
jgi:hypothetical protein